MAFGGNPGAAFGLVLDEESSHAMHTSEYRVVSDNSNAMYIGDCVTLTGAGDNTAPGRNGVTMGVVDVVSAGDSNEITGVIVGIHLDTPNRKVNYKAASTAATVTVVDDPLAVFLVRAVGTVAAGDVGAHANLDTSAAGSTATGKSGMQAGTPTASDSTGVKQLQIVGVVTDRGYTTGTNGVYKVRLNRALLRPVTVAV